MKIEIKSISSNVLFTHDCENNSINLTLGAAVRKSANLEDAYLKGANLTDANLAGAILTRASLAGASLRHDVKIIRLIGRAQRSDDYTFMGFQTNAGLRIKAGCRLMSPDEYRAHIAKEYPGTPKAAETLAIIQHLENRAAESSPPRLKEICKNGMD